MIQKATMVEAVGEAAKLCEYFMIVDTGQILHRDLLMAIAERHDRDEQIPDEAFYMVSREGAIGMAAVYEYLVQWMFVPAEPEAVERGKIEEETEMYLHAMHEIPDDVIAQTIAQQIQGEDTVQQPQAEADSTPKFCGTCGTPITPGDKFCKGCGRPLIK